MASPSLTVVIETRLAWWWWPYFWALVLVALTMGAVPDQEKFNRMLARAFRFRFAGARTWQRVTG